MAFPIALALSLASAAAPADGPFKPEVVFLSQTGTFAPTQLFSCDLKGEVKLLNGEMVFLGCVSSFSWSPKRKLVAFISDREVKGRDELWIVPATGGTPIRANGPLVEGGDVTAFAWSPDGSRVAYLADQAEDGVQELWVTDADGSHNVRVSTSLATSVPLLSKDVDDFAWSPKGSRLAYAIAEDLAGVAFWRRQLHVVAPDGTKDVEVAGPFVDGGNLAQFAWSPNGSRIAFRGDRDVDGVYELFVASADGKKLWKASGDLVPGGDVSDFEWSPNGSRIAYRADADVEFVTELYVSSPDGKKNAKVSAPVPPDGFVSGLAWAPNGSRLAYRMNGLFHDAIHVASADGKSDVTISDPTLELIGGLAWAPKGARVAYASWEANVPPAGASALHSSTVDGKQTATLVGDLYAADGSVFRWSPDAKRIASLREPVVGHPTRLGVSAAGVPGTQIVSGTLPDFADVKTFRWTADGKHLVYSADPLEDGRFELFVTSPDTPAATLISGLIVALQGGFGVTSFEMR